MWVAGSLRHTTAMDGGSADIARSKYLSAHPWTYSHRHPWLFAIYRPSLGIAAPSSMAPCVIPSIHGHKKSNELSLLYITEYTYGVKPLDVSYM